MTDRHAGPEGRQRLPPRLRLAGYVLGVATGLGVNELSADGVGYRGVAVTAAVVAILVSTQWLRQLPSRAPLIRIVLWVLLGGAVLATVVAVVSPGWEGPATIAAAALTTSAVLIPTDLHRTATLLAGVAVIGVGVALIGVGVAVLREGDVLAGVAVIGVGVAVIGVGVAVLREGDVLA
nr:hypothetical protein [Actinomycetota bacterium]